MAGRRVLPLFGGGPAVWTTCMLLFQALLLAGYAYAHVIAARLPRRVHWALLAASQLMLPRLMNSEAWTTAAAGDPVAAILILLVSTIGLPYLVLATTGPLMQ